ncbi:hypothetical protein V6N11_054640 [Hibiscus sabdariffa]|uniref:Uncharacterized protein n=1 Tax=Hibiscus sabdariffa TaxID=183260 RepID=A0ABR2S4R7_9ROSI
MDFARCGEHALVLQLRRKPSGQNRRSMFSKKLNVDLDFPEDIHDLFLLGMLVFFYKSRWKRRLHGIWGLYGCRMCCGVTFLLVIGVTSSALVDFLV